MVGYHNFLLIGTTTISMIVSSSLALAVPLINLPAGAYDIRVEPDEAVVSQRQDGRWQIDCFNYKGKVVIFYKTTNADNETKSGTKTFNCGGD